MRKFIQVNRWALSIGFISSLLIFETASERPALALASLDFRGGVNWSTISDSQGEYGTGYSTGLALRLMPLGFLGGTAGVDFLNRSAKYSNVDSDIHYIDFPVTASMRLGLGPVGVYLEPGIFYAIPLKDNFYDVGIAKVTAEKYMGFVGRVRGGLFLTEQLELGMEAYGKIPFQASTKDQIVAASFGEDKIYDFGISATLSFGFL